VGLERSANNEYSRLLLLLLLLLLLGVVQVLDDTKGPITCAW
jgi:hypothetical protein